MCIYEILFQIYCYVDLFGFLFGGFMLLFHEVGSEVIEALNAYEILDGYLEAFMFFWTFI